VFYSPNAAERGLAARVREAAGGAVPEELRDVRGRIVGCIGRVDPQGYWWDLVEGLSAFFPDVTFVFVGGLTGRSGVARERALRALGRRNVRWVGEKAHKELPRYLARFDLCLNPMAVTEANDRRSFLRLYDYLATEKPILSSAVREAKEHEGHVVIGRELQECVVLLGEMLDGAKPVQREERRRYAELNTWERRAAVLWERVGDVCA
jgi:glycosyltransferase involved in cell wall biosynthesis